jgi:ribosome biogenesis GTPase A
MSITWFPGHMATSRKKAAETMAKIDVVIEVLDARIPGASSNPTIEQLRLHRQRPCLKVLNKSDLADPAATAAWVRHFSSQKHVKAVALSCKKAAEVAKIPALAASLVPNRGGMHKPVRMMVMGVPNAGKSTLVNALLKRKVAKTGDEPAITRHQSRWDLGDNMALIDTPGLMWPVIRHESDGLMLAASHAIGENAFISEEVATFLGDVLLARYPALLAARYECKSGGLDGPALIEAIARKRGYLLKGNRPDYEKAGNALVFDYRSGALGRISLETPQSRAAMIGAREAEKIKAEKSSARMT